MVKLFGKGMMGGVAPREQSFILNDGSARFNWAYMNQIYLKIVFINWFKGLDGLSDMEKKLIKLLN